MEKQAFNKQMKLCSSQAGQKRQHVSLMEKHPNMISKSRVLDSPHLQDVNKPLCLVSYVLKHRGNKGIYHDFHETTQAKHLPE